MAVGFILQRAREYNPEFQIFLPFFVCESAREESDNLHGSPTATNGSDGQAPSIDYFASI